MFQITVVDNIFRVDVLIVQPVGYGIGCFEFFDLIIDTGTFDGDDDFTSGSLSKVVVAEFTLFTPRFDIIEKLLSALYYDTLYIHVTSFDVTI